MIFTIGARKKVHLPDKVLYQRLGILLVLTIAILTAWTTSNPPEIKSLRTSEDLLFYTCRYGPWEYAALAGTVTVIFCSFWQESVTVSLSISTTYLYQADLRDNQSI